MLQFDEETTAILAEAYRGADFAARRLANFDALGPKRGESILDLGCGTGALTVDLARAVGPEGRVIGLDLSADMLRTAKEATAQFSQVELVEASADQLPLDDASANKVVSIQVFEYFRDLEQPLSEITRVLKPGGLLVVGDMHFDSFCWHSEKPERMQRMLTAWDRHLTMRDLPARLGPALRRAGLRPLSCRAAPFVDTSFRPDGLARMMSILMPAYARQNDLMEEGDMAAWLDEQHALADEGQFFFAATHFVWAAMKP